ncbi:MAG: FG-GAP repeat domain-containing protein [Candidatus Rokuibacteriota bacterium]
MALLSIVVLAGCGSGIEGSAPVAGFQHGTIDAKPPAVYRINDIAIGDIDRDGRPDVWTSGRGGGAGAYQMVWYKNPSWTRYEIAPGDFKYGALADLDGDGDLDVVVGRYWFENQGTPTRRDWPRHSLGHDLEPDLLLVADIDHDGRLDVVFSTKEELYWLRRPDDPKRPWKLHRVYRESGRRTGGAVADIDGDGDLDILWGNAWFERPSDPTVVPWPKHVIDGDWPAEARGAVADLDGDGRSDVVLSDEEGPRGIAWYRAPENSRGGRWVKHVVAKGYTGVHSLQIADLTGDGKSDIFAAEMHTKGGRRVTVFDSVDIRSNTWTERVIARTGSHNAKVADLDGDGYPDVVGKNFEEGAGTPLRVDVWWNKLGCGPLSADRWKKHVVDDSRPWRAVFVDGGDLDGDGLPDIVSGGFWYRNPGPPGGTWKRHAIGGELHNMAVVHDLDGDRDLDILGTKGKVDSDELLWAENDGRGSFRIHQNVPRARGDFLQGARAARILPGGQVQVVLSWHNGTGTQMLHVPSPATSPWRWQVLSPTTNAEQIAIGDVDGDGDPDIHLGTEWLRNDGEGWTAVRAVRLSVRDADPDRVELADVDGDGDLDVVIGCEHARCVVWGENPGRRGGPWREHRISTDILALSLDVADVDGDGDVDVVVGEHNTGNPKKGRVVLYLNGGRGETWAPVLVDSGLEHHDGTRLIDIDNDGDLDLISIGWTHGTVVLYENEACAGRSKAAAGARRACGGGRGCRP